MDAERRKKLLILVAIVCVGGYLADTFVLTPGFNLWKRREARIGELGELLAKSEGLSERESSLNERWEEMRKGALPNRVSDAEKAVFESVSRWAGDTRLSIAAQKPRWVNPNKESQMLEVQLDATGNMESVSRFIFELETGELPLKVENLEITAQDNKGERLNVSLRFTALVLEELTQ